MGGKKPGHLLNIDDFPYGEENIRLVDVGNLAALYATFFYRHAGVLRDMYHSERQT